MEYKDYLKSEHWKNLRAKKYNKPRGCAICHSVERLEVHHLVYKDLYNVDTGDLRVLCAKCHRFTHFLHKKGYIKFIDKTRKHRYTSIKKGFIKYFNLGGYKNVTEKLHNIWDKFIFDEFYEKK